MSRAPFKLLLLAGLLGGLTTEGLAITAPDARTKSFKLQSEGMRLYRLGNYKDAIDAFRQVVNLHLNSFLAWYYLGASLVAERRYGEAIEPLKIALDLQPDYVQAHLALGDAYLKQGETSESRAEYLRALDLQPTYAAGHDGLGRLEESLGHDAEAEAAYRKALEINVAFADAYTHLGEMFLRQGRLDDATQLFLKAIAMKPDFSQAYTRLGVALSRQGRFDDAIAAARTSLTLSPNDPEPHVALARINIDLQEFRRAHAELQAAFDLDPEHVYAHVMLSELKRAEGDPAGAVAVLEARLERGIEEPRMKRIVVDRIKARKADAARFETLQAAAAGGAPAATAALGRFYAGQNAHLKAAELLSGAAAATTAAGDDPALRYEAALEYLAARHYGTAIETFESLGYSDAAPDLRADALFNLGVARAAIGLDPEAAQAFQDLLARQPDDRQAMIYRGNALLRCGRRDEARAAYTASLAGNSTGADADQVRRILSALTPAAAGTTP
jgi:superkiller protein 3